MASGNTPSSKSYAGVDYVNDYIDLLQTLVAEQAVNLGGVVDNIQENGYSVDQWTSDVARFWAWSLASCSRLALLPVRRATERGGVLPTLVFLVDSIGQSAGPQTLDLSKPLQIETVPLATELKEVGGDGVIPAKNLNVKLVNNGTLEVTLLDLDGLRLARKAKLPKKATKKKGVGPTAGGVPVHYTGVIYGSGGGQRSVLAVVYAVLDVDANEPGPKFLIPQQPAPTPPQPPAGPPGPRGRKSKSRVG